MQPFEPVVLPGRHIRIEPLAVSHLDALVEVGLDEELWRLIPIQVKTREDMLGYIRTALQQQKDGTSLPFATVEQSSGRAIGSTRYMNIDRANRHVEIGSTWIARAWQRTAVNTEAKYLMLRHAFEIFRLPSGGIKDRRPERAIAQRHPENRRQAGRHIPQARNLRHGPRPRQRLFQHHRFGVAGGEGSARTEAAHLTIGFLTGWPHLPSVGRHSCGTWPRGSTRLIASYRSKFGPLGEIRKVKVSVSGPFAQSLL